MQQPQFDTETREARLRRNLLKAKADLDANVREWMESHPYDPFADVDEPLPAEYEPFIAAHSEAEAELRRHIRQTRTVLGWIKREIRDGQCARSREGIVRLLSEEFPNTYRWSDQPWNVLSLLSFARQCEAEDQAARPQEAA